jgi:ubiquinone/menaquinone biosynthesis C-methylase UbiE
MSNPIVQAYSRLADQYDDDSNMNSCWGRAADRALALIRPSDRHLSILDVGCGTGRALALLASRVPRHCQFVGVDPADNMRRLAAARCRAFENVRLSTGSFESIPADSAYFDYIYSIFAFHWTTDLGGSVRELARVLKPDGEMDLFFIGRNNGHEFIGKTTPIFLKYLRPEGLIRTAQLRKQLTREAAFQLFSKTFDPARLSVEETYETYYDSLEGHWGWWVRIEGHFVQLPPPLKQACDREVKAAIGDLDSPKGIPYTIHRLHVRFRRSQQYPRN